MTGESFGAGCERVRARLEELVDGTLRPLQEARDHGHLEACDACRSLLARHERLLAAIRMAHAAEGAEDELKRDLAQASRVILERVAEPRSAPRSRRALAALVAVAAVVLVVLAGSWLPASDAWSGREVQLARIEPLLERLPGWSEVVSGLGRFSRWICA